jgi:hypothetical protein
VHVGVEDGQVFWLRRGVRDDDQRERERGEHS